MTREQLFAAFFFAVFLFLLYQFYLVLSVFMTPIAWAALLALVFYPAQQGLTGLLRDRPGIAALILTTLVIGLVIVPTILITGLLVGETAAAYERLREMIESGQLAAIIESLRGRVAGRVGGWAIGGYTIESLHLDVPAILLSATNTASGFVVSQAGGALRNVVLFLTNFFLTTFALFFFFRDGSAMVHYVRDILPMEPEHKDAILTRFYDTMTAVVQGSLVTAVAQGLLAGIGYAVAGVPFATLFGCLTAFLSLLPAGASVVWVPIVIYLGVTAPWYWALALLLWCALVVGNVDNVLRIWIIGERTRIPTILLFFGMLGGLQVYGFLGMFLGPVLIATLVAVVQIYRAEYAG
jgi:predicted PurR-regulated permease PerM